VIKFSLIQFLITINTFLCLLLIVLFFYIFIQKYINKKKKEREEYYFKIWESGILALVIENDETKIRDSIRKLQSADYESFMDFITVYMESIAEESLQTLTKIIHEEKILYKIKKYTDSSDLTFKIYFIYFLGVLKINDNIMCPKNHLNRHDFKCEKCRHKKFNLNCYSNALNDPNPLIKIVTVQMIARTKRFEHIETVLNLLIAERIFNLPKMIEILFEFGSEAAPYFYDILKRHIALTTDLQLIQIKAISAELLGRWNYQEAAETLLLVLKQSPNEIVIKSCINALGKMKYKKAATHILINLELSNYEIKISCMKALFTLEYPGLKSILEKFLNDDIWEIRYVASNILFDLGFDFQNYLFDLSENAAERAKAYRTIVHVLTEKTPNIL